MNKDLEYRSISFSFDAEHRKISGLAIPINSWSEVLTDLNGKRFREIIEPTAVNFDLINRNDIRLYVDHLPMRGTLARSKFGNGTLHLEITERGLEFSAELPNTELGNEILEGISRGDYDAVSFGMRVKEEEIEKDYDKDEETGRRIWRRHIKEIGFISEISILSQLPAYSSTEVGLRSLEDAEINLEEETVKNLQDKLDALKEYEELVED